MTTLIDRYVDEAAGHVGAGSRDEVRREIHGMVDELVEARVEQGEPADTATERVLNELGDPRRFAREYAGETRFLIGPRRYDEYIAVLKAVATRVLPITAIVVFAVNMLAGSGSIGSLIGEAIADAAWITFNAGVQIAFWVTVIYAVMERTQGEGVATEETDEGDEWTVADLPPPKPERQISRTEALAGLALTLFIAFVLVYAYRNGLNPFLSDERSAELGRTVPIFNPEIPVTIAWLVLGLTLADAALELVKFVVGRWTRVVTGLAVGLNVVWIGVALAIVNTWDLANPGIRGVVSDSLADFLLGSWVDQLILAIMLVTAVVDIWEAVRGYLAGRTDSDRWSV